MRRRGDSWGCYMRLLQVVLGRLPRRTTGAARKVLPFLLIGFALGAGTAHARWLRAETSMFVLYSDGTEAQLRDVAQNLHAYDELLRLITATPADVAPNKLTIYLVGSKDQVREVAPFRSRDTAGFYQASLGGIAAVSVRTSAGGSSWAPARAFIFHEYTHHFVAQYHPSSYPSWFNEGIAEYFSTTEFKKGGAYIGGGMDMRAYVLANKFLLPFERMLAADKGARRTEMFYPQSWLMVHYMMDDSARSKELFEYLKALNAGEDPIGAFTANFNMTPEEFIKDLGAYLRRNKVIVRYFPVDADKPVDITVTTLPESANDLLLMNARLRMGNSLPEKQADDLDTARQKAAAYPDDALALRTLAWAEMDSENFDASEAAVNKVLAADPKDTEALLIKAFLYFRSDEQAQRESQWPQARPTLAALYKLDPSHAAGLYLYALSFLAEPQKPSENTLNIIMLAHSLAPQINQIAVEAGVALYRNGDIDGGKSLLQGVAYSVHSSSTVQYARETLAKMEAGEPVEQPLGVFPTENEEETEPK